MTFQTFYRWTLVLKYFMRLFVVQSGLVSGFSRDVLRLSVPVHICFESRSTGDDKKHIYELDKVVILFIKIYTIFHMLM